MNPIRIKIKIKSNKVEPLCKLIKIIGKPTKEEKIDKKEGEKSRKSLQLFWVARKRRALACNIDMERAALGLSWRHLRSTLRCFWHSVDQPRRPLLADRPLPASVALVRRLATFVGSLE